MNEQILNKIIESKKLEIERLPEFEFYVKECQKLPECKGFLSALRNADGPALIAEVKKASPSKGVLTENFDHVKIALDYQIGGAHCLSVLTDEEYFQGKLEYLKEISTISTLPCLRKDFIIDPRQIVEARLNGADAILLIVKILDEAELRKLHQIAVDLGLDVLVEVHDQKEMEIALGINAELIGINNRDLNTFETSIETSMELYEHNKTALENKIAISESGIRSKAVIDSLHKIGFKAFLVGESLISQEDQKAAIIDLIS